MHYPILIIIGTFFLLTAVLYSFRKYKKGKRPKSSFRQDLLRSPGQSRLAKLDAINEDLMIYRVFFVLSPVVIFAVHIAQSFWGGARETLIRVLVSFCAGFILFTYIFYKMIRLSKQSKKMRLGYEGELAVGQELEQLQDEGFYVYHDFPADQFKIDHIVVSPKGVFAVETMARSKPASQNRMEDTTVEYNGRMLYFPRRDDYETIDQAKRQASWLSDWLGAAIGEPIAARAIVALPGWIVKRTSSEGIPVVNPKQFLSLFEHIKPRPISESIITRINRQLDQKCRDIEPKSKNHDH